MDTESKKIYTVVTTLVFDTDSPVYRDFVSVVRDKRELPQLVLTMLDYYATSAEIRAVVNVLMINADLVFLGNRGICPIHLPIQLYKIKPELLPFIREFQDRNLLSTLIETLLKLFYHFKAFRLAVQLVAMQQKMANSTSSKFYFPAPILSWVNYINEFQIKSAEREVVSNEI